MALLICLSTLLCNFSNCKKWQSFCSRVRRRTLVETNIGTTQYKIYRKHNFSWGLSCVVVCSENSGSISCFSRLQMFSLLSVCLVSKSNRPPASSTKELCKGFNTLLRSRRFPHGKNFRRPPPPAHGDRRMAAPARREKISFRTKYRNCAVKTKAHNHLKRKQTLENCFYYTRKSWK